MDKLVYEKDYSKDPSTIAITKGLFNKMLASLDMMHFDPEHKHYILSEVEKNIKEEKQKIVDEKLQNGFEGFSFNT